MDSTLAYQTAATKTPMDEWRMKKFITDLHQPDFGILTPSMTVVLTAPDEMVNERLAQRYGGGVTADFIESRAAEYHAKVRRNYIDIVAESRGNNAVPSRYVLLENKGSIADLMDHAIRHINQFFQVNFPAPAL